MSSFSSDIQTLIKHSFLLNFLYELLMSLRRVHKKLKDPYKNQLDRQNHVKSTSVVNFKSNIKVQKYSVNF